MTSVIPDQLASLYLMSPCRGFFGYRENFEFLHSNLSGGIDEFFLHPYLGSVLAIGLSLQVAALTEL